jgi:glycosyltransferase involved in cell wall biosynthesis
MSAKVTIGLCVKNSEKIVETALNSILRQDYPFENLKIVVVVDDESEDRTLNIVTAFISKMRARAQVFSSGAKGLGASRQMVIDNAEGDYIVWVDDDFVLKRDFIRRHVEFMEKNPDVGAARSSRIQRKDTLIHRLYSYLLVLERTNKNVTPSGAFLIFRTEALKQVGGFDVNIKGASEDQDIARRIKDIGWRLSSINLETYYQKDFPATWKTLWHKQSWYGYGQHFIFHKYGNKLPWDFFFLFALWIGFRNSLKLYPIVHEKQVFLLAPFCFYISAARFSGFISSHHNGYGHNQFSKQLTKVHS